MEKHSFFYKIMVVCSCFIYIKLCDDSCETVYLHTRPYRIRTNMLNVHFLVRKMFRTLTETEFLEKIQTKVLRVLILAKHSRLYSFALWFAFLQANATSYDFNCSVAVYTVKEKGGQPDRKPYPLPYGLWNPYRILKSQNFQDDAEKPQQKCTFMNSASWKDIRR